MKVIVHNRETTNINGEDSRQFSEPVLNPLFVMCVLFSAQKGASDTP